MGPGQFPYNLNQRGMLGVAPPDSSRCTETKGMRWDRKACATWGPSRQCVAGQGRDVRDWV